MGLKRIDIKKIEDKKTLKVTCYKRRNGLFNKARTFCNMTGAQMAIITFTPGMRPMTFGNPSVESVIDQYELLQRSNRVEKGDEDHHGRDEIGLSDEEREMIEGMGLNELEEYASRMEEEKEKLVREIEEKKRESSSDDMLKMYRSVDVKLFGVKIGEKRQKVEIEENNRNIERICKEDSIMHDAFMHKGHLIG